MKRTLVALAGLLAAAAIAPIAAPAAKPPNPGPGPHQLTIAAQPTVVTFGRPVAISGRLTGPNSDNRNVELQKDQHPFEGAFVREATAKTDAAGLYAFRVFPLAHTVYRAQANVPDSATSPAVTVLVRKRVSLFVSDRTPEVGERVRFSGRTCPEHDGAIVHIQRRTSTGWRHVAHATLRDEVGGPTILGLPCSTFARRVRIYRDGTYRAVVAADADHARGVSRRRALDAHL